MNRRPHIDIKIESPSCAMVSGYGARELIQAITKRSPVWATVSRAWVMQTHHLRDLVAACEVRGWDVTITGETGVADVGVVEIAPAHRSSSSPASGLW